MTELSNADQREAAAILQEVRQRPAYHVACIWLERLGAPSARLRTKGLLVGIEAVVLLMRESFRGRTRGRPTLALALSDRDLGEAVIVALIDRGFQVAERPQRWCAGRHLATNIRESELWQSVRSTAIRADTREA